MAKERKKRGLFKKNEESSTPNTPEVNLENTETPSNDIFSEETTEKETSSEPTFFMPSKSEANTVIEHTIELVKKETQNEAAQAPIVETAPIENIDNLLNQPIIPVEFQEVTAFSNHSDEMKLEKFLRMRKGPTPNIVYQGEVMSSGINMTKIGLLEGKVGKFKLNRSFISEAWTITIE